MNVDIEAATEWFAGQRENAILWLPVFLGVGICAYFGLRTEPGWGEVAGGLGLSLSGWLGAVAAKRQGLSITLGFLFVIALGFAAAKVRTAEMDHVILKKNVRVTMVEGTIDTLEFLEAGKGVRAVMRDVQLERLPSGETPQTIRLTIRKADGLLPGQRIRVLAGVNPPSPPVSPDGYDFQRDAYFRGIGAFGYAYKAPEIMQEAAAGNIFSQALQRYRAMLARRAVAEAAQPEAGVMVALLNGDQRALPKNVWDDIRIAGLAHIIAISGANISMAAGIAFFISRFLMALWPRFALYHPIKTYAAGVAFLAALAYALVVGLNVPTFRALVMTGLVLLAVALNRSPFSLRMAAVSAFALLLLFPEYLLGASFQMSFAAVVGLIVFYDLTRGGWLALYARANWAGRIGVYFIGIMAATILATIVTAPFSLANFQQFSTYGVVSNVIVVPVVDFWIMPLAILIYFLAPMGWDGWAMRGMERGVRLMVEVAHEIAGWPYAQLHGTLWPEGVLGLMVMGVLFTVLWRGRARWVGLFALLPALALLHHQRLPDVMLAGDAKVAMIVPGDGSVLLSTSRAGKFAAQAWMKENGIDPARAESWPRGGVVERGDARVACDTDGCLATIKGKRIAFSFTQRTLPQDCRAADIVVSFEPAGRFQCAAKLLIDRWDLKDNGAYAIRIEGDKAIIRTAAAEQGDRPWSTPLYKAYKK